MSDIVQLINTDHIEPVQPIQLINTDHIEPVQPVQSNNTEKIVQWYNNKNMNFNIQLNFFFDFNEINKKVKVIVFPEIIGQNTEETVLGLKRRSTKKKKNVKPETKNKTKPKNKTKNKKNIKTKTNTKTKRNVKK